MQTNRKLITVFVLALVAFMVTGSATTVVYARHRSSSSSSISSSSSNRSSGIGLTQLASNSTDFPNNDEKAIQVHVKSAKKDSVGYWHVVGEVTNTGNSSLSFVQITAHFYAGG